MDESFCSSCDGEGGQGDWLETGEDTCAACGGTGQASASDSMVVHRYCPKCSLIYPTGVGVSARNDNSKILVDTMKNQAQNGPALPGRDFLTELKSWLYDYLRERDLGELDSYSVGVCRRCQTKSLWGGGMDGQRITACQKCGDRQIVDFYPIRLADGQA